jgi:hypothetical protein
VQWRACSQALLAIASIKRTFQQFITLLVYFAPQPVSKPRCDVASDNDSTLPSTAAASSHTSSAASTAPHRSIALEDDGAVPSTPASIFDTDDCSSSAPNDCASPLSGASSAVVSDSFLSELFGEQEALKIFQPFL